MNTCQRSDWTHEIVQGPVIGYIWFKGEIQEIYKYIHMQQDLLERINK